MPKDGNNNKSKIYAWPSSKITAREMAILVQVRELTGVPINVLLQRAVLKLGEFHGIVSADSQADANADAIQESE